MTLLEKAKLVKHREKLYHEITPEEIELIKAFLSNELTCIQISSVVGTTRANVPQWIVSRLKRSIQMGVIKIT